MVRQAKVKNQGQASWEPRNPLSTWQKLTGDLRQTACGQDSWEDQVCRGWGHKAGGWRISGGWLGGRPDVKSCFGGQGAEKKLAGQVVAGLSKGWQLTVWSEVKIRLKTELSLCPPHKNVSSNNLLSKGDQKSGRTVHQGKLGPRQVSL